jgi:predicted phage-related endonuclease
MKTLEGIQQGSEEWLAVRRQYLCASESAAMLGYDKNTSRSDLLRIKATGSEREFSEWAQKNLLDKGLEIETAARGIAEQIIGEDLYPITGVLEVDGLALLASFDGVNITEDTIWECKSRNAELIAALEAGDLPDSHWPQVEQQLLISGAGKALFTPSDGTEEGTVEFWYESKPPRRAQLLAAWKQFQTDLAEYQYAEVLPAATSAPTLQLPALTIQVNGSISVIDNLKVFGERLESFISGLDKNPSTDQSFADCESAIKTLGAAETALEAAKASALAQTADIDTMTRTVALYAGQARTTRLMLEKLVKTRKETIRVEIVQTGRDALAAHIASLNKRIGRAYMPLIAADWNGVIRAKKTVASLKDAVAGELARAKIEANAVADKISLNMASLRDLASAHTFLFSDAHTIVQKENEDLIALIKMRIAEHAQAENKRIEAEREKIRAEEAAKLQIEQERKEQAERERKEREQAELAKVAAKAPMQPAPANEALRSSEPITVTPSRGPSVRPSATAIIAVLCVHFGASENEVRQWLADIVTKEAA